MNNFYFRWIKATWQGLLCSGKSIKKSWKVWEMSGKLLFRQADSVANLVAEHMGVLQPDRSHFAISQCGCLSVVIHKYQQFLITGIVIKHVLVALRRFYEVFKHFSNSDSDFIGTNNLQFRFRYRFRNIYLKMQLRIRFRRK